MFVAIVGKNRDHGHAKTTPPSNSAIGDDVSAIRDPLAHTYAHWRLRRTAEIHDGITR